MNENSPEIQAVLDLQRAGKRKEAKASLNDLIQTNPKHAEAIHMLGIMCYQERDFEGALKHMQHSLEIEPVPSYYSNLGNVYADLRQFDKAKSAYQSALRLNPNLAAIYGNMGNMFRAQNKFEQAIFQYQKGLRIDPKNPEIFLHMASMFFDMKRYPQAIENYEKVLSVDPKRLEALNNLGSIYHQQGNVEKAIPYYEQAIEVSPAFVAALFNLANLKRESRDLEGAKKLYKQVTEHHPDMVEAHLQLAQIMDFEGDAEGAESLYKEILKKQPREEIYLILGERAAQRNEVDTALGYFKAANELNPYNPDTCYNLGSLLKEKGDSEGASHFLGQALQMQDLQDQRQRV